MPQILRQAEEALEEGDFPQALALLAKHLQANPVDIRALSLKCHAEIGLTKFDTAFATAKKIGEIYPDSFEFHASMGAVLTDQLSSSKEIGTVHRAIQHMERAIMIANSRSELIPSERSGLHYNLANAKHQLYLYRRATPGSSSRDILETHIDAIAEFDIALKANSANVEAWVNKGNILDEAGRYVESLDCYMEALRRNPKHSMALGNRGLALAALALRLPKKYQTPCLREAGFFLEAGLAKGEFGERYANDPRLKATIDGILKLDRFDNADLFVSHLMEHVRPPQAFPRTLGAVKTSDLQQFAEAVVRLSGLRLAFGEDLLLQSPLPEDWVDVPLFLSGVRSLGSEQRLFLVSLIDRYRTARNLLVLALSEVAEFDVLSRPDRLGFPTFSMNGEILKDSLKTSVDLLDSVAYFLLGVAGLGFERVTFSGPNSLFFKPSFLDDNRDNQQLLALASLSLEVSRGEYRWLNGFRNARTHEYLLFRADNEPIEHPLMADEYHFVGVDEFIQRSVQALRIARAAILYTILYVLSLDDEEALD